MAVSLDYAPEVSDINEKTVANIDKSNARFEFLAAVFRKPDFASDLRRYESGDLTKEELLDQGRMIVELDPQLQSDPYNPGYRKHIAKNGDVLWLETESTFAMSLLEIFVDKQRSQLCFLGSVALYNTDLCLGK